MSLVTAEHVQEMIRAALVGVTNNINSKFDELKEQVNLLNPTVAENFLPVAIDPRVDSGNTTFDLIKSVPEFDGDSKSYPSWRSSALFAMSYYPENSEKYYVSTGILRNKIVGKANTILSSFNTVLNVNAIIARLDKSFSDQRPLHVLENELSILQQGNLSLTEFYDNVGKQLTLIINKQMMTFHGQNDLISALNERARENALRIFISGLRRPLCDILFSARPNDLPSALVIAQELEMNHRRYDFARAFALGNSMKTSKSKPYHLNQAQATQNTMQHIPMDVDTSGHFQRSNVQNYNKPSQNNELKPKQNTFQRNVPNQYPQNYKPNFSPPPNPNIGAIPKRPRDYSFSNKSPFHKQQKINHMAAESSNDDESSDFDENQSQVSEYLDDISNNEINFLG